MSIFIDTYNRFGDILVEFGVEGKGPLVGSSEIIRRMVFASAIGGMEAFLGDSLVNAVLSEKTALRRIITGDRELNKVTVTLADVFDNQEIVEKKTRDYLAKLIYHNLAKIEVIYDLSLGVKIFPDPDLKERLSKAVSIRHDIVHRNGKDKAGDALELSFLQVRKTLDDVLELVQHIHQQVEESLQKMKA